MSKKELQQDNYRAERKKRLAQNAKKKNKNEVDSVKVVTLIVRIATVIIAVCIAAFALYQFGVPQKLLPAVKIGDKTYTMAEYSYYYTSVYQSYAEQSNTNYQTYGIMSFDYTKDPALQTTTDEDGNKITYDEVFRKTVITTLETTNYYLAKCEAENITLSEEHIQEISQIMSSLSAQADTQGVSVSRYISIVYGKGLDSSKFQQLLGEQLLVAQYLEGVQEGLYDDITDEELEKAFEAAPSEFQAVDIRLFGFEIAKIEGKKEEETTSATEETTKTEETTSTEASTTENTSDEVTTDSEETTVAEEEKEKEPTKTELLALDMLNRIRGEESFIELAYEYASEDDKETFSDDTATLALNIKKSVVASQIGEDLAEWLYSKDRVVGDKTTYTTKDYVYVIYIIKTAYREEQPLVDARHILISFDAVAQELNKTEGNKIDTTKKDDVEVKTDTQSDKEITNEGTGYSIELVTETYKRALAVYNKYMSGEKTETSFAKLAEDNSTDTGSIGNNGEGGLYTAIEKGKMVKPFENWVYDEARKPGDVDIIMTNYGWHIMYFVKQHDEPAWKADARTTLGQKAVEEFETKVEEETKNTATTLFFFEFAASESRKNTIKLYG